MFNEREMSKAIDWLFELFSPEDYEGYDEEEIGYAGGLCLPEVCIALRGVAQTVYQYSVVGGYEKSFNYRGEELFDQRGCLILSDMDQAVWDDARTTYETELWLMEDMSFFIVRCVTMKVGSDGSGYVTEYRAFKKILKSAEDLFFSPEELIFFQGTYDTSGASHVGIYVGNGMMIHCGNPISYASIETSYWQQHFYCFGRIRN